MQRLNWCCHSCNRTVNWQKQGRIKDIVIFFVVPNSPSCNAQCLLWLCFVFTELYQYSWLEFLYYCLFTKSSRDQEGDNVKTYKYKYTLVPCGTCSWLFFLTFFLFLSAGVWTFLPCFCAFLQHRSVHLGGLVPGVIEKIRWRVIPELSSLDPALNLNLWLWGDGPWGEAW